MSPLPQPPLPPGPVADLFGALHELHHRAGWPSLRRIAAEVGCSHTTVSVAFSEPRLPRWGLLELIVEALDGDVEGFRELWLAASAADTDLGPTTSVPAPAASTASGPAPAEPDQRERFAAPRELPAPIVPVVGRAADLARLDDAFEAAQAGTGPGVVLITGPAGVGKTCLAVAWSHTVAGRHPDGQLYLDLRGYDVSRARTPAAAAESVLRRLGVAAAAVPRELADRSALLRSLLAGRRLLLVLDNAHSADQVAPLLPGAASCFVVVTSRDGLPSLVTRAGAQRIGLRRLDEDDATTLLAQLIGKPAAARPDAVAELARRCAYLPLALRVAAEVVTRDPDWELAEQVARFEGRAARLDLLDAGGDERTSVRSVFSWSRRRLGPQAGTLFELLGFSPSRELETAAAAALLGAGPAAGAAAVDELLRAHLVERRGDAIGLHDLLRDYVVELAARRPAAERHAARQRLFDHHVRATGRAAAAAFADAGSAEARTWLDRHRQSLLAVARSAGQDSPSHCLRLAALLHPYLEVSGYYGDAIALQRTAIQTAQRPGGDRAELAGALRRLAGVLRRSGALAESLAAAERTMALYEELDDRAGIASALDALTAVHVRQGRNELAGEELARAVELHRELGDGPGEAAAANRWGIALMQLGRFADALARHEHAYALYRTLGQRVALGRVANNVGVVSLRLGRYEAAHAALSEALTIATEVGNRAGMGVALANLGEVAERRGRYADAVESYRQGIEVCAQVGYLAGLADARRGLGVVLARQGAHAKALETLRAALELGRGAGDADVETATLNDIGLAERLAGADGAASHRAAYEAAGVTGDLFQRAKALDGLAWAALAGTDVPLARSHWLEALGLFDGLGVPEAADVRAELARLGTEAPSTLAPVE
ncbi:ATP-binding protein [Pseudofrankia inefficax]|uniref:NB-ARC domain protein n=1 Tax=Pseudofrankia inefficax (strain DSM 45817 / CECT 9037 / DDB 130130 / EuI1c) TaxID=298654 RepID=E3IY42_PSEI1|nr:tetratricopeptide repeat protein [Pseudofrankia inefficax]ADP82640.1 NB-ARC domain protein [Pseudofrankia inefficax]